LTQSLDELLTFLANSLCNGDGKRPRYRRQDSEAMSPDCVPVSRVEHGRILSGWYHAKQPSLYWFTSLSLTARTHLRGVHHIRSIYHWFRDGTTFDDVPVAYAPPG